MSIAGRRSPVALLAGILVLVVLVFAAMLLYDHSQNGEISKGVRIGGVDVGGMGTAAARRKVEHDLLTPLEQPVTVRAAAQTWRLTGSQAGLTVDVANTVSRALAASRGGSIFSRSIRGLTGGRVDRDIPLEVSYSRAAVRTLTAQVRTAVARPAREATVKPSAGGLQEVAGASGMSVNSALLGSRIERALTGTYGTHTVLVPTKTVAPAVTTAQLAEKYPAYIVVDRSAFRLRFYQHLKLADTYEVAIGMQGLETPAGLYEVQWKQVNPPWYVPKSKWAGKLAGKTIPPGPEDPLKARFMSFDGSAGIHGVAPSEYGSIGHTASHGCVRMRIPDVIALYSRTPVGTPVYIA